MALFRPYERRTDAKDADKTKPSRLSQLTPKKDKAEPTPVSNQPKQEASPETGSAKAGRQKKNAPTPTRRQAEAERMERLHPSLTPGQQRRADRRAKSQARYDALDRQEQSPERVLLRDVIDSRWTINEFVLPLMILVMALSMTTLLDPATAVLGSWVAGLLWLLLIMAFINTWFMWRSFKVLLEQRVPGANRRGLLMYMFNRSIMIRRFRRPAPRIARGEAP